MKRSVVVCASLLVGCGGPTFTNLGNGVGVPVETLNEYAQEHEVTRAEARVLLKAELDARRIQEHADTHGISEDETRRQLEHASRTSSIQE